jgi:hypothetical protein
VRRATTRAAIHDVFVARQPIFDAQSRLFAYELLYRGGAAEPRAHGVSPTDVHRHGDPHPAEHRHGR